MKKSNQIYKQILDNLEDDIINTFQLEIGRDLHKLITDAKRIFITGSGSSVASAIFIEREMNRFSKKNIYFHTTSQILEKNIFNIDDVAVLVSQGWNRRDAYDVTKKCIEKNVDLIVVSGRIEKKSELYNNSTKIYVLEIKPNIEKIFCRPNSPITNIIQLSKLFELDINKTIILDIVNKIKQLDFKNIVDGINKYRKIIFLTSSSLTGVANNLSLMMREGAGKESEYFEIESYGHGMYTNDQENRKDVLYILLESEENQEPMKRIYSLIKNTNSNYLILNKNYNNLYSAIYFQIYFSYLIYELNNLNNFDMNNPKGMEENRSFHDIV